MPTKIVQYLTSISLFLSMSAPLMAEESIAEFIQFDKQIDILKANPELDIHSIVRLTNLSVNNFNASELSGLAWDEDEKLLYALSDKGYILHLRPVFSGQELTDILLLDGFYLKDEKGNRLRWKQADSEGLDILLSNNGKHDDSTLLVCFERIPRVIKFSPNGQFIEEIKLPELIQDINNYQSENRSLEAITSHPGLDIILGLENSLKKEDHNQLNIYSITGQNIKFPSALDAGGGLSGMTVFENNDLLILERGFSGIWPTFEFALHRITIHENDVQNRVVATFPSDNELFNDNFEGITRHTKNNFFMVSDDNNHPLKRTLLVYFEIK